MGDIVKPINGPDKPFDSIYLYKVGMTKAGASATPKKLKITIEEVDN